MQRLSITNMGPIAECNISVKDFMVLTGPQASGKSTIAKSIFFFNNLKKVLFSMCQKNYALGRSLYKIDDWMKVFSKEINKVFIQSFGIEYLGTEEGSICYEYDNGNSICIEYGGAFKNSSVHIVFNQSMQDSLNRLGELLGDDDQKKREAFPSFIDEEVFASDTEVVYIPAGRSMLTVLSSQINYLYSVMDDRIRSMIDYSTQEFMENVLLLKGYFNRSYEDILRQTLDTADYEIDADKVQQTCNIMKRILGGEYRSTDGEERLYIDDQKYVRINYASSGQQEAVWIINILFYYMLGERKTYFIVEEPESHLFPETQKAVVELISLVKNDRNKVLITTHSPYVLGTVNNLLYANYVAMNGKADEIKKVVSKRLWLDFNELGAYYIANGSLRDISDSRYQDLDHDVIDGVSGVLNDDYNKMLDILGRAEMNEAE